MELGGAVGVPQVRGTVSHGSFPSLFYPSIHPGPVLFLPALRLFQPFLLLVHESQLNERREKRGEWGRKVGGSSVHLNTLSSSCPMYEGDMGSGRRKAGGGKHWAGQPGMGCHGNSRLSGTLPSKLRRVSIAGSWGRRMAYVCLG